MRFMRRFYFAVLTHLLPQRIIDDALCRFLAGLLVSCIILRRFGRESVVTQNSMESAASTSGWIVGLAVAGFTAWLFISGGIGLPSGRYPIIFLAALFIGPHFIAGGLSGGLTYLVVLKSLEAADDARARSKK